MSVTKRQCHASSWLLKLYLLHPVTNTFWSTLASHVMHSISRRLFSYATCESSNEGTYLIEPVIRELTRRLLHLLVEPPQGCLLFTASLSMEHKLPFHGGLGRPATVDFCILLRQKGGEVIRGGKGHCHVKQLSAYMWKVSTSEP